MNIITTNNLTKTFSGLTAVHGLTLSVKQGELFGLIGADGAGKTTTMRMLAGIMDPTKGDAWVLGKHCAREAESIKDEIGYMSQRFGLYPDLTVLENIQFYADIYGIPRRGRAEKIDTLLAFSNLSPFRKRQAGKLSGGMKQKLGLACALIHTPKLLLLDEPTNGVDPVSRRDFWRILYRLLGEGVTIFVTTSYLDEADRCNRVGLLHRGRLLASDTPDNLKRLMKGTILEVRTTANRRAAQMLAAHLPNASVGQFGDRIHIATEEPETAIGRIEELFRREVVELSGIRTIEPSLEDVFVSVLSRENGA